MNKITDTYDKSTLMSQNYLDYSSISETTAQVTGKTISQLETFKEFAKNGTAVKGGNADQRVWNDKSYVPITLKTQCIDCLHCVVACPHSAIHYDVSPKKPSALIKSSQVLLSKFPGFHLSNLTEDFTITKAETTYDHCKACYV